MIVFNLLIFGDFYQLSVGNKREIDGMILISHTMASAYLSIFCFSFFLLGFIGWGLVRLFDSFLVGLGTDISLLGPHFIVRPSCLGFGCLGFGMRASELK